MRGVRFYQQSLATKRLFCTSTLASSTSSASTTATVTAVTRTHTNFKGIFPILVTPFLQDQTLDLESLGNCVRFMKSAGVDGVVVTGVLGESNRLLDVERELIVREAIEAADGMPVIVGCSHSGTYATAALCQMSEELGASGVMLTMSKEPTPQSDECQMEFFSTIASKLNGLPIVLQDHPASTNVFMSLELQANLVQNVPSIKCIKLESPPTPSRLVRLRQLLKEKKKNDISILTGLGGLYSGFDLAQGCDGFMTGFAFPEVFLAMCKAHHQKRDIGAQNIFKHWLPLIVFEQQPGVAIRKEIYLKRKLITENVVRHPGQQLNQSLRGVLDDVLKLTVKDLDITKPLTLQQVSEVSGVHL